MSLATPQRSSNPAALGCRADTGLYAVHAAYYRKTLGSAALLSVKKWQPERAYLSRVELEEASHAGGAVSHCWTASRLARAEAAHPGTEDADPFEHRRGDDRHAGVILHERDHLVGHLKLRQPELPLR